jgi:hypothetical protein
MQNNIWTEQLHLKNMEKNLLVVMNVGLVVIVANGQVILNIIKIIA